ncbi:MAG: tyrosine-type recombinase/integrase [Steroidobacteraceae bacterium]
MYAAIRVHEILHCWQSRSSSGKYEGIHRAESSEPKSRAADYRRSRRRCEILDCTGHRRDDCAIAGGRRRLDERQFLCVAYETLARRGELVAPEVRDIEFWPSGTGQALIRRGKTDAEGQGRVAYLSRETVRWLKIWLEHAQISEGPIFCRLIGRDHIGDALHPGSIAPIFKRVARWIGMPARFVAQVSGHCTRVGAAQDLAELDIDLAAITQAGGWKSPRMPLQYAEKINAARSGMARAAAAIGRDKGVSE